MSGKREYHNWLEAFLEYSSYSEAPLKSLWWAGVSAVAGSLQRNVWIDQGLFSIYPNFFIVINGPAGKVKKSTIVNLALKRLQGVQGICFAPDSTTWEGLIQMMEEQHKVEQAEMTLDTVFTRTIPITVAAPEFSVFIDFADHAKVSALTHLWDCPDTFRKHTKFSGAEYLEKPCINLIAGTTPSWIRENFDHWTREGGFASRCIWLHEANKAKAVAWLTDVLPKDYKTTEERLSTDLAYISRLQGPYRVSKEAHDYEKVRYDGHHARMLADLEVKLGGFQDRKQVHILKTAMVCSAARGDDMTITLEDLQLAEKKVNEAEMDMVKTFAIVDERVELRPYKEARSLLEAKGSLSSNNIFSALSGKYTFNETAQAIAALKEQEDVQLSQQGGQYWLTIKREVV